MCQYYFHMNRHNINLLDIPNEILFHILRKLSNVDVLNSLLGIKNRRLEIIAQQEIFTNILDFVCISRSTDEISPIPVSMLVRFCDSILPRIHMNVKTLIVESDSMERILRAASFPNLTELKIYNFNKAFVSRYFMSKLFVFTDIRYINLLRCTILTIPMYFFRRFSLCTQF